MIKVELLKKRFVFYLLLLVLPSFLAAQNGVSILYFNDAHEITPVEHGTGTKGGVARLKTIADSIRKQKKALLVFGGDLAGGTLFGKVYKGFPMVEAFNKIPVDIANFGQHEFDFGIENTRKLVEKSNFRWVTSNLTHRNGKQLFGLPRFSIFEIEGMSIAFLGITDQMETSIQGEDVVQQDIIFSVKETIRELRKNHAPDYLVAITQTPMEINRKILQSVPELDLIFTEETSEDITEIQFMNNQYLVSTIGNMGSVAEIKLEKNSGKISVDVAVHYLGNGVKSHSGLHEMATNYQNNLDKTLSEKVGFSINTVERGNHRQQESVLGNLIADAYRDYYAVAIGMMNAGGIRNSLPKGDMTRKDVYAVLPFDNKVGVVELSGEQIIDVLNNGLKNYTTLGGEFLQVSGMNYAFATNAKKQFEVTEVMIGGKPLARKQVYRVALPDYIINGGGAFDSIPKDQIKIPFSEMISDTDVFLKYLKKNPTIDYKPENRIIRIK